MNVFKLGVSAVRTVTPPANASLLLSTGSTPQADGSPQPTYAAGVPILADVQPLGGRELAQVEALNLQAVQRVARLSGNVEGVNRIRQKGGDVLVISEPSADAGTWLVVAVLETWGSAGWCTVALTLQARAAT